MSLNRRDFLISASVLFSSSVLLGGRWAFGQAQSSALPKLAVVDARENLAFRLEAIHDSTDFIDGAPTPTLGFNQSYLGPVVRVRTGTTVNAEIVNATERVISVHWHGLLIPGDVDGGPHQTIPAGGTWQPGLAIDQPAATLWYHTHVHGGTADGVYAGLAGVLLVDDGRDNERGLPNNLGTDDLVLVIQDKRIADNGMATYHATADDALHGFLGDRMIVNGVVEPRAAVPPGIVRLRLINACNARNLDLAFADGRSFDLIATDQGLLPSSHVIERLRLSPGERAEILVDFADGAATRLVSRPHDEGVGAMGMDHAMGGMERREDPINGPFAIMEFEVDPRQGAPIRSQPAWLAGEVDNLPAEMPTTTRTFVLNDMGSMDQPGMSGMPGMNMPGMPGMNMGPSAGDDIAADVQFGINGQPFAMDRIDHETIVGSTERWIVGGQMMGHPFHIHGARFRVLSEGGGPPRVENSGWKDTVFVTGEVELLAEFPHLASPNAPFMFHCHVLEHEDRGMMGQFTVVGARQREYSFDLVEQPTRDGPSVFFSVHLVDVATGERISDAAITVTDFNMEPEGMAGSNQVTLLPQKEPGVQPMQVRPDMAGRWALVLEAVLTDGTKVQQTLVVRVPN